MSGTPAGALPETGNHRTGLTVAELHPDLLAVPETANARNRNSVGIPDHREPPIEHALERCGIQQPGQGIKSRPCPLVYAVER